MSPTIGIFLYVAKATNITHKRQTSKPPVGFETTVSAGEGAVVLLATGFGEVLHLCIENENEYLDLKRSVFRN